MAEIWVGPTKTELEFMADRMLQFQRTWLEPRIVLMRREGARSLAERSTDPAVLMEAGRAYSQGRSHMPPKAYNNGVNGWVLSDVPDSAAIEFECRLCRNKPRVRKSKVLRDALEAARLGAESIHV
jgi:hypothetical protein